MKVASLLFGAALLVVSGCAAPSAGSVQPAATSAGSTAAGSTAASAAPSPASVAPSSVSAAPSPPAAVASAAPSSASPAPSPAAAVASAVPSPAAAAPSSAGAATPGRLDKLAIGSVTSPAVLLPLFYARDNGIFTQLGIDPTIDVINAGSSPVSAALSGQLQILSISAEAVAADVNGADFVYVYAPLPSPPFSIYAKSDITSVAQLAGKSIAVSSLNSSSEALAKFAVQQAGLKPGDVKIVNSGSPPNSLAALTSGQVDAGVFSPPSTFRAEDAGFHELFNGYTGGFQYLATASALRKSFVQQNRDLVLRYVKAMILAEAGIVKDKPGALRALAAMNQGDDPATLNGTYDFYAALFRKYQAPAPSVASVRAALDDLAVSVPAAKNADPSTFIDASFVNELQSSGFIQQAFGG